ncbi:NAD(P)-binding protein [Karstenula rhodostoma CBS 690.94]|uniref:NAD(P)-binding protein n=1 Tax=Karstenula rhodostoma CBS 690.94 TaxID=1392251 RepID=A0A9P4UFS4_9PLEO|nr:NAD(P)-binding protein [Karstenula rhodostoma CBS 690.94]
MSSHKLVMVTGANRGIGRAICTTLLSHPALTSHSLTLYATSRQGSDLKLSASSSNQRTRYASLDITSSSSIENLISELDSLDQKVDILINNAGVNLDDDFSPSNARKTIDTNYRGTLAVCTAILPLLTPKTGRIVNLSSAGSSLDPFSPALAQRFRTLSSLDDLDVFMREYLDAVVAGKDAELGFPSRRSYGVSKAAVNALTAILARENAGHATINCCCPGWVDTDMGNLVGKPWKTPEQGARIPVRLAVGDVGVMIALGGLERARFRSGSVRA